jgi:hypothetical protein
MLNDRRKPDPDRRQTYRGGRRALDYAHGTRALYKRGCTCLLCRAAEAAYRGDLRKQHATGHVPLGSLVSAAPVWRMFGILLGEQYRKGHLALLLGRRVPKLNGLGRHRVTRRTALKVRRLFRVRYLE